MKTWTFDLPIDLALTAQNEWKPTYPQTDNQVPICPLLIQWFCKVNDSRVGANDVLLPTIKIGANFKGCGAREYEYDLWEGARVICASNITFTIIINTSTSPIARRGKLSVGIAVSETGAGESYWSLTRRIDCGANSSSPFFECPMGARLLSISGPSVGGGDSATFYSDGGVALSNNVTIPFYGLAPIGGKLLRVNNVGAASSFYATWRS